MPGKSGLELDAARVEAAETEIDRYIARRVQAREEAEAGSKAWTESERRYYRLKLQENREAWHNFHLEQAERIENTARELAKRHRAAAASLLGHLGGG